MLGRSLRRCKKGSRMPEVQQPSRRRRQPATIAIACHSRILSRETGIKTSNNMFYNVEIMADRDYLGEFEHLIVLALLRLDDRAYGVTVRQEIELRTKREVSIGAVYATLDRLETKGYVKSFRGDPTPERGGRSKRFFRVTPRGLAAVNRAQRALQRMTAGLELIRSYS